MLIYTKGAWFELRIHFSVNPRGGLLGLKPKNKVVSVP